MRSISIKHPSVGQLLRGLAVATVLGLSAPAMAQLSIPTSHPGSLPAAPTTSMIFGSNLSTYQGWWATPVHARQTAWKNNIVGRANQTLTLAVPADFNTSATQASVAMARALRYAMDPTGPSAANDLATVTDVLKNYAKCVGGTNITKPEVAIGYYLAFDYVNSGLSAADRSAIITRLSGSNVQGTLGNFLMPPNNQQAKRAATRGLGALLFNNNSEIDSMLSSLSASYGNNTTNDGGYTDAQNHYFGYQSHQVPEFLVAYKNHTGIDLGPNIAPFATMALGMQQPNGTIPSFHNGTNGPSAIGQYTRLINDPTLKANALWTMTQMDTHDWTSWSNILNNDWNYTTFFPMEDFSVTPTAPTNSPTFFSGGQADNAAFRNNWTTSSNYLGITGGVDGKNNAGFVNYDTGAMVVASNGAQVISEPGYNRTGLTNTPAGFDSSRATEHNIILAKDTGGSTWGAGTSNAQTNTGNTTVATNRLDSKEFGGFAGVSDFQSLDINYGTGTSAGADTSGRRDTAFPNEEYFIVADQFKRTDTTNKDFAFNLIGKGPMTVVTNTSTLIEVRWDVTSYGTYNNGATMSGYPYNQPQNGAVIEHLVSGRPMTLATDQTWMHENYDRYQQTNRMRASVTNVTDAGFISIMELTTAGAPSEFAVTNLSATTHTAAKVVNATDGWTDVVLSQPTAVSRTADVLTSDARYAYGRWVGGTLENLMIAQGTNFKNSGADVIVATSPITLSLLFDWAHPGSVTGSISADNFTTNTELRLYGLSDILTATINGGAISFTNGATYDSVILSSAGSLAITYSPEPSSAILLGAGSLLLMRRPKRRQS